MSDDLAAEAGDRPLLNLVRRHGLADVHYLAVGVLLGATKSFVGFADVFLVGLGIDALFNDRPLAVPLVPESWVPADPVGTLLFVSLLVFAVNVSTVLLSGVANVGYGVFAHRLLDRIRVETFDAAQRRGLAYYDRHRTGDAMSALNDDVNQLETFFTVLVGAAVWIGVTLVAAVVYMSVLNAQLALFVLASAPLVAAVNYWFARRLEPRQEAVRSQRGALNADLETSIDGVEALKAYTAEDRQREQIEDASLEHFRARLDARRLSVVQTPLNRLVVGAWLLATLGVGVYWVLVEPPLWFSGTLTAGQLVPFLFYLERVSLPLKNLGGVVDGYEAAKAAAGRVDGIARGGRMVADGADARDERSDDAGSESGASPDHERSEGVGSQSGEGVGRERGSQAGIDAGRVEFEDVTFRYPGSESSALEGVSFEVRPGETVGVVGSTGAGKSTLVKLLLGLYAPDEGAVRVDGASPDVVG